MKYLRLGAAVSIHLCLLLSFSYGEHEIGYTESFSPNNGYTADWCADDDTLHFRLTARSRGWVAVGFSDNQLMAESDIVMATGEGVIQDSWAFAHRPPPADASQDVTLHSFSQSDRTTTVEFSRPRVTGDERDLSLDTERFIVWAMNATSDSLTSRHSSRGFSATRIDFAAAASCSVGDPLTPLDDGSLTDPVERQAYVHDVLGTWIGDSNVDGEFNSSDLIVALAAGTYEVNVDAGWATGDFDGSGRFDTGDLIFALADGGYDAGPRPVAVPEPSSLLLLGLVFGPLILCRKPVGRAV